VSARDARERETDGIYLPAGSHERPKLRSDCYKPMAFL